MKYSACIELLFQREAPQFADRNRLAKASGLDAFEFWRWTDKDIDAVEATMRETGLPLAGIVAEPMIALTDPAHHGRFLEGLARSIAVARRLGAGILIAQAGDDLPGRSRAEQRAALTECLGRAADALRGSGVTLALEPLNTLVDHPGYFLSSTSRRWTSSMPSTGRKYAS